MAGASPEHGSDSPKRLTNRFVISILTLVARFAKQATHLSIKFKAKPIKNNNNSNKEQSYIHNSNFSSVPSTPKSPLGARGHKQLITNISNKAIMLIHRNKKTDEDEDDRDDVFAESHSEFGSEFGDGGVWQREILMGDKCQPLDFSGAIYYDNNGKQLPELPLRSPRASPLPGYLARKLEA